MEIKYFWITNQVAKNDCCLLDLGQENLVDYFAEHHLAVHHRGVRPYYLHMDHYKAFLPRAPSHCIMQGCVGDNALEYGSHNHLPILPVVHKI